MTETAPAPYDGLDEAKTLLRSIRAATLATLQPDGFPLATLTTLATDYDGSPILLLSQLAAHTKNLDADNRCALLLAQGGKGDPLAHPRLSLVGVACKVTDAAARKHLRRRFLNRNPKAALYADFGDFAFWRMDIAQAHLNGGFAKAANYSFAQIRTNPVDGLNEVENQLLADMNADNARQPRALALAAGEADGPWRATGLDGGGLDLACGDRTARTHLPEGLAHLSGLKMTKR